MSSSKRSAYFYSPLKIESDQRDIIIAHLKEEIYLLKRNEQELVRLEDQYRMLEHRFRALSEEKVLLPTLRFLPMPTSRSATTSLLEPSVSSRMRSMHSGLI